MLFVLVFVLLSDALFELLAALPEFPLLPVLFVVLELFEVFVLPELELLPELLFTAGAAGLPLLTTISIVLLLSISSPGLSVCVIT